MCSQSLSKGLQIDAPHSWQTFAGSRKISNSILLEDYLTGFSGMQKLWIVGSSIEYWADMAARQAFDQHLG